MLTKIIRNAKCDYHRKLLVSLKNKSSKLWSYLKTLINPSHKPDVPINSDTLNDFFTSVFKQAPQRQPNYHHTLNPETFINNSCFLFPVSNNEVHNTITSLSNSQSIESDGLQPNIIKSNALLTSSQLTYIFNLLFTQAIFPKLLKTAIITSIHKSGSRSDPSNYRPISILTTFSNILEKLFLKRVLNFINKNNILHENQFGFRQGKSTSVAITHLLNNLINNYNANKKIGMALLNLKKTFDFINHDLLLIKLKHYGLRGTPLRWIYSYLTNRTQRCKVNNDFSKTQPISAGVPQGSLLGPILFNIFINNVFQFNTTNIQIFLYADDTVILFKADNETDLQKIINDFFFKYTKWCLLNCIFINPTKSNYLFIAHPVKATSSISMLKTERSSSRAYMLTCVEYSKYCGQYM